MDKFTIHTGVAAPIMRNNIDTDTIIPSREMRAVSKSGLSDGLFAAWRYHNEKSRTPNPDFVLNQPEYQGASILISGNNFGCGSSREHAVWALKEFGIRCIIAEGFGSIFFQNCVRNGILPIKLERQVLEDLVKITAKSVPKYKPIMVDLTRNQIMLGEQIITFSLSGSDREMLIQGLDPIAMTLKLKNKIDAFQQRDARARPWV